MSRRSHRQKRVVNAIRQLPWADVVNPYAPVEVLKSQQIQTIIDAALAVLETQGMRFLEPAVAICSGKPARMSMPNHSLCASIAISSMKNSRWRQRASAARAQSGAQPQNRRQPH